MSLFSKRSGGGLGRGIALSDDDESIPHDIGNGSHNPAGGSASMNDSDDARVEVVPLSKKEEFARKKIEKARARAEAKANKPGKVRRGKTELSAAEESARLSNRVLIEFYPGLSKSDAIETAKNWALNHFENPTGCFYLVQEVPGGWGVEVQEGVGKAYLPSVIDLCMEHPGQVVVVPMVRRKMTVAFSPGSGEFEAQVLREGAEPVMIENSLTARRGVAMIPVMSQHKNILIAGIASFAVGSLALLISILLFGLDPKAKVPPEWRVTEVPQLPVMQWNKLRAENGQSYVVRFEFQGDAWRVVRQSGNADVSLVTASGVGSAPIVPGVVPALGVASPAGGAPPAGAPPAGAPPSGVPPISPPGSSGAAPASGAPPVLSPPK